MSIAHWPEAERPREKLLQHGAGALSDAELLAILLRTGVRGRSAVDMGRQLLQRYGTLGRLMVASRQDFARDPGLGPAKFALFMAVRELTRRLLAEEVCASDVLSSPEAVRQYLRLAIGACDVEVFMVIYLSVQNGVLACEEAFRGTLNETRVYPREIVRRALHHNASALIVAHNHPSGVAQPSAADLALTVALKQALALVDICLLDHFVVTGSHAESLAERGLI